MASRIARLLARVVQSSYVGLIGFYQAWSRWLEAGGVLADGAAGPEAEQSAELLLQEMLGPLYESFVEQGYLDVPSTQHTDVVYRLRRRQPIEVCRSGVAETRLLCVTSVECLPSADQLIMKLLWLRADEASLLATANYLSR